MRKLIVFHIYGLGHFESLEDIEIDYLVVSYANNSVAYALSEQVNGARAHLACHYPVSRSRRSAALDMAENGCSRLDAGLSFDFLCYLSGSADALGNDNYKVLLAGLLELADTRDNIALDIVLDLGHDYRRCADSDARFKCEITCAASHDLDDRAAVVRLGSVADAVDHLNDGVKAGVITYCIIGAGDIVVDSSGQSDARNAAQRKIPCASERAVAADDDHAVDAELFAG